MMTYDERNRQEMSKMDPVVAERLRKAMLLLDAFGQDVLITSGKRTEEYQDWLWESGRKRKGPIVTHVKGRASFHVHGVAFDLVPVRFGIGMGQTNPEKKSIFKSILEWSNYKRYEQIARVLTGLDFQWGYQMWGFDHGHFQYTQGLNIEDFYMGKKPKTEKLWEIEVETPTTMKGRGIFRRLEIYLARFGIKLLAKAKDAVTGQ